MLIYGLLLSLSGWYFGYQLGMFNTFFKSFIETVYPHIQKKHKEDVQGNLQMYMLIGGIAACLTSGYIIETLGRYKTALLYLSVELCVIVISLKVSLGLLYSVRFMHGYLVCSWSFLALIMIKEILPSSYKNLFACLFYVFFTMGIMTAYIFAFESVGQYWRYVFSLPALFDLPKLLAFIFIFNIESPKWIIAEIKDPELRLEMLRNNLSKIYTDEEVERLVTLITVESTNEGSTEDVTFSDLIGPKYVAQFMVVVLLNFLNQMTGNPVLVFYSGKMFKKMDLPHAKLITLFMGSVNFIAAVTITLVSQRISKKTSIVVGLGLQTLGYFIFLLGIGLDNAFFTITGVYLYMFSYTISLGALIYPYQTDILPPKGIGIAATIQWIMAAFVGKFSPKILKRFDIVPVFIFFMLMSFLGFFLFNNYAIDTENKTDEEIRREFMDKKI